MPRKQNVVKRAKNRRRINWRQVVRRTLYAAIIAVVLYAFGWLLTTPRLTINSIVVKGNRIVPEKDVQQLAKSALGTNIFLLRGKKIRQSVVRKPEIRDVKVRRRLPGTVVLHVKEREPAATISSGSRHYEIDKNGLIFRQVRSPAPSVPLISLKNSVQFRPGEKPNDVSVTAAMNCLKLCNQIDCEVTKLSVDPDGNVCLNMGSGFYVKLGQAEQVEEKLNIIRTTLKARPDIANEALYIDVSCPSAPALKLKS